MRRDKVTCDQNNMEPQQQYEAAIYNMPFEKCEDSHQPAQCTHEQTSQKLHILLRSTVKPVLSSHLKIDKTKFLLWKMVAKLLNAGRKYFRMLSLEHSAIPLTCIKLLSVLKTNFWCSF